MPIRFLDDPPRDAAEALCDAVRARDIERVRRMLAEGADPNGIDTRLGTDDSPPLFDAAQLGDCELVALLLEAGAEVNARSAHNQTALIWACDAGHIAVARMLLEAGADPTLFNDEGYTARGRIPGNCKELLELLAPRRYAYVGPPEIQRAASSMNRGTEIRRAADLVPFANGEPLTYVVGVDGILRVAHRRSEHVACAGGDDVLAAGELTAVETSHGCRVVDVSNLSTGYCPMTECWPSVRHALDVARIEYPNAFTFVATFRRCPGCGERNLVKDEWFHCAICNGPLPEDWNF